MTDLDLDCDVLVIGAGMGGSAIAFQLRNSGLRVLVVERGDRLPREPQNWDPTEVFVRKRYRPNERWRDLRTGDDFSPGVHYNVGGNTKVYGACLPRFREHDFDAIEYPEGVSPEWPISYAALEPYYAAAERELLVHGDDADDPTSPWRSSPYPFPPLPHEPSIAELADSWREQGLSPVSMPMGIDLRDGGACIRCGTCDGFPCSLGAKADAETSFLDPALRSDNVTLLTRATVVSLTTKRDTVGAAVIRHEGAQRSVRFAHVVLAAGAVNTASLLLRSGESPHNGLANSSGLVGRNYMVHNSTFMVAVDPRRKNTAAFTKTLGLHDWYKPSPDTPTPLGGVQMLGKLQTPMISAARPYVPKPILGVMTERSMDLYLTTEDLPSANNGVRLHDSGKVGIEWTPSNLEPHAELTRRMRTVMRTAGYPLVFSERMGIETNSHMCGTATMGDEPSSSVIAPNGQAHDVPNLWIADSSVFPSSAALNPALTIAANAMRTGDELLAALG